MGAEQVVGLFSAVSLVVVCAYIIGRNRFLTYCINNTGYTLCIVTLIILFGVLSIIGTYTGVKIHGALANTRMVGTLMGGFMGGPIVGTIVGGISGLYRYHLGGFTGHICGFATFLAGVVAGVIRYKIGLQRLTWKVAAVTALVMEIVQKVAIIFFAKPFEAALELEKLIAFPTILVTVFGSLLFIIIIEDIKAEHDLYGAQAAKLSLDIASLTLPYLRHGLTVESAQETAQIIHQLTHVDSVMITDSKKVLAAVGRETNLNDISICKVQKAIDERKMFVSEISDKHGLSVTAPLIVNSSVVGTVKLSRYENKEMSELDIHIVDGLAKLLAVQIQLAEIDDQKKMRARAELKALQAQINPHFLFNTINIIMSFCRTHPDTARNLLGHLATMMHRSFANKDDLVTLNDELTGIKAYLEIAKARFGARLTVNIDVDPRLFNIKLPVLCIQPLVENAVQHGLFPKLNECNLAIIVRQNETVMEITVEDNGVGIPREKLHEILHAHSTGIGINNVNSRIKSIYGAEFGMNILSEINVGTTAIIKIPIEGDVSAA